MIVDAATIVGMELRSYTDADLALTRALEIDPIVMRHLGGVPAADRAQVVHDKRLAGVAAGDLYRTVVADPGGEPVGLVAIWTEEFEGAPIHEFGVMFRPGFHRRGLGMSASRQVIAEFKASGKARELHAFSAIGNVATDTGAPVLGFRQIGDVDLDYEGAPLRCHHWLMDL